MNFFKVSFPEMDILEKQVGLVFFLGWSYWQFKKYQDLTTAASPATTESFYTEDGELEMNKVRALSRSYAQAIAGSINYYYYYYLLLILFIFLQLGQPISMIFNPTTARFQLVFTINTDIHQPTIIYINEELNYPQGCDIKVSPVNSLTWNSSNRNYYEFIPGTSTKNDTAITILITPKTLNVFYRFWNWIKVKISFWKK
jgi:endoglycosylceramidase